MKIFDNGHSQAVYINEGNKNAYVIGIALKMAFVLTEVIAGFYYNSMALRSDAGHNFCDAVSLVIPLIAFKIAKRQSSPDYTFGFKKITVLSSFVNALVLLFSIVILGSEAFMKLFKPQIASGSVIALIALIGIFVNVLLASLFSRQKHELNSRSAYLHLLNDARVSVFVVITGIAIYYKHLYLLDPVMSLVIVTVMLRSTWPLLTESFKMIIDAVPSGINLDEIKEVITSVRHVQYVSHVRIWSLSTTENALTALVIIDERLSFEKKLLVMREIKLKLEHYNIRHSTIELAKNTHSKALKADESAYVLN
jgi:cobalt-zinc-cadmium efflux system protein